MSRPAERGAPAPAHQPLADIIVDRDQVPGGRRAGDDRADFGGEFRAYPLVGVDFENPVAAAGGDPGVAARPFPLPSPFDDAVGEPAGDLARPVGAAVEQDDDLVGKAQTGEAVGELRLLVMRDDEGGEAGRAQRYLSDSRPRSLATRRHSRRAAASATSTDRLSISVSVVRWSKPGPNIASGGSAVRTTAVLRAPRRVLLDRARAEQAQGRRADGRGDVHQPGIVADEQRTAPQHRRRGQQIDLADQVDSPIERDRREQRLGLLALMRGRQHRDPRAPAAGRPRRSAAAPARQSARPAIACRANSRPGRSPVPARPAGAAPRGALVMRRRPQPRARRRVEVEQAAELAHPMLARVTLGHDPALAGAQQPGERRAAQIDDKIPAPASPRRRRAAANAATSAASR